VKKELLIISNFLKLENKIVYPEIYNIPRVFLLPPSKIKVIILGQDCYHNGSATGLAFSVKEGNKINPSLRNIGTEIQKDGFTFSGKGDLTPWFNQGVFLLNTALTVESGAPESHLQLWEKFTKKLISYLSSLENIVWMVWGKKAYSVINSINKNSLIIRTSHPSPYSYSISFKDSHQFQKANEFLKERKINWSF
jgi:uracil-DNA glycosylase